MLATKIIFNDKTKESLARTAVFADALLAFMAIDMEILIKTDGRTPFNPKAKGGGGRLRTTTFHEKRSAFIYRVASPVEYAAVQEAGVRAGARPFSNYTTPGTGPGFFKSAVNKTVDKKAKYVQDAKATAGIH